MMSQSEVWLLIFKHVGTFYVVTLFAFNSNTEHASTCQYTVGSGAFEDLKPTSNLEIFIFCSSTPACVALVS